MAEYQLIKFFAWDQWGMRHYITISRRSDYYLIRHNGDFFSTAECMCDAMDEVKDCAAIV